MAADYEEVIRKWGYNMPETIVDTLVKFAGLSKNEPFELLDLGCGPGLCGMTLKVTYVGRIHLPLNKTLTEP